MISQDPQPDFKIVSVSVFPSWSSGVCYRVQRCRQTQEWPTDRGTSTCAQLTLWLGLVPHPWIRLSVRVWLVRCLLTCHVSWVWILLLLCTVKVELGKDWWLATVDYWSQFHVSDYVSLTYDRIHQKSIDFYLDFSVNRCHGYILVCQHVGVVGKIFNVIIVLCAKLFIFQSSGVVSCFPSLESYSSWHSAICSLNYYSGVKSSSR